MVLHQDLAVLRSCSYFFSAIPVFLSCCCLFVYYAVLRSVHPRSPRAAVRRRVLQQRRPTSTMWEEADSDVRGWEGHPSYPLSLRECEPLIPTRVPIVSLFLELGLFAPGVLPVCLMMAVNVMASNRHLRWWSPPVSVVGEQTVGRVIVCPWSGERSSPCPASVMCAGVVSPCRPGRCRHRSKSSSYCGRRRTSKTVVHQRLGLRSIGVTRPSSTLLLGVTWLWQSGTCPPLLQMASREVARGVWQRRRHALMTWQRTPFIGWSTSPPRLWLTDGWYVGAIVCALEADKWVWSRQQRGWMTGLIWSNVSTAPCQSDNGPGVMIA